MSSTIPIVELRNVRLNKARSLREKGISPYPAKSLRSHYTRAILDDYDGHEGQPVTVAGRLMSWREHGALTFGHVQDQTGRIQLYIRQDTLKPTEIATGALGFEDLNLLDVGDFVEATGKVTKTKRGEVSVMPDTIRILAKSLRPLPDKWLGLKDREAVLRRRYLDTTISPENKGSFEAVSKMLYAIRSFLDRRGFLECLTPIIQPQYGGGTAKPFITHVNALDCEMYLAISHELYLKRLIAAGFDKVYTIGRYFRNEGIDRSHHPEFSMVETMTAYENYEYNMDLIEDMFRYVAETVFGKTEFMVRGHAVDFGKTWRRVSMNEIVRETTGIDFRACQSVEEANQQLAALGLNETQATIGLALAYAFEERVGDTLISPTFVYGHPLDISPLAKPMDDDPNFVERFEIFIAGMECGDNWSEQNDPVALLDRWKSQFNVESEEFQPLDYDFIEMLEHGMPPTTGIGPGVERMAMIFTGEENIDNVIFFPMMKPALSAANAAIYEIDELPNVALRPEEVPLTMNEFASLVEDRVLQPETAHIKAHLHLHLWSKPSLRGKWVASGHIELDGFLKNKRLRVAGYTMESDSPLDREQEADSFKIAIEEKLDQLVRARFPDSKLHVEDVVVG